MLSGFAHVQFNVRPENLGFYGDVFGFLGWQTIHSDETSLGLMGKFGGSVWFIGEVKEGVNNYDGPGVNHIALGAELIADVESAASYLESRGAELLFETPRHRPEFSSGEADTYYQIMFGTPDGFLIEFVYQGPK